MKASLEAVHGIGPTFAATLRNVGIATPQDLIERVDADGAHNIASAVDHEQVNESMVLRWVGAAAILLKRKTDRRSHIVAMLSVLGVVLGLAFGLIGLRQYGLADSQAQSLAVDLQSARGTIQELRGVVEEQSQRLSLGRKQEWAKSQAERFAHARCASLGLTFRGNFVGLSDSDGLSQAFDLRVFKQGRWPGHHTTIDVTLSAPPPRGPYRTGRSSTANVSGTVSSDSADSAHSAPGHYYFDARQGLLFVELPLDTFMAPLLGSEAPSNRDIIEFFCGARISVGDATISSVLDDVSVVVDGVRAQAMPAGLQQARQTDATFLVVPSDAFARNMIAQLDHLYPSLSKRSSVKAPQGAGHAFFSEMEAILGGVPAWRGEPVSNPGWCDCDDGLDNDGDGLIDFPADPGCVSRLDISEWPPNSRDESREYNLILLERINRMYAAERVGDGKKDSTEEPP